MLNLNHLTPDQIYAVFWFTCGIIFVLCIQGIIHEFKIKCILMFIKKNKHFHRDQLC